jgi:hypothetical protein
MSAVLAWCALGTFMIGSGVAELRRQKDADEPFFPRGIPNWSHARGAVPWLATAFALLLLAGLARLFDA